MKRWMFVAASLAGCGLPVEKDYTGPEIVAAIAPDNGSQIDSSFGDETLAIDPETQRYVFSIGVIEARAGTITGEMIFEIPELASATLEFSVPGEDIPDSPLERQMSDGLGSTVVFVRRDKVTLPATAMGKQITIHAEGEDDAGTRSNLVDWIVTLE